ncbi:hypothetical protein [Streptomyces sp. GMR22]|uniref:hypothetical protein n=1 Tax=Streptomyces sp. GMR22 TaxID=2759524 RepID=UPI0015FCD8F4|nr:hypothetical protein [Streptomyces sp. GMR22]MBA6434275.1 hypothetical protein [Streptomyces sp. GMR22]
MAAAWRPRWARATSIGLGWSLNAAVLWTTRYLDAAVTILRALPSALAQMPQPRSRSVPLRAGWQ